MTFGAKLVNAQISCAGEQDGERKRVCGGLGNMRGGGSCAPLQRSGWVGSAPATHSQQHQKSVLLMPQRAGDLRVGWEVRTERSPGGSRTLGGRRTPGLKRFEGFPVWCEWAPTASVDSPTRVADSRPLLTRGWAGHKARCRHSKTKHPGARSKQPTTGDVRTG